jgi:AcrR family transcriptional regulator
VAERARGPAAGTPRASPRGRAGRPRGGRLGEVRDAALTLFAGEGYAGTNMTDLANAVQLGAPSLYNHIDSKAELLREICVTTMGELMALQREALEEADVAARLRLATESHVRFSATRQREIIITSREFIHLHGAAREEVLELRGRYEHGFRSLIEEGHAAGVFHVPRPKLASYAIIEMGLSVAQWFRADGPVDVETLATDYGVFALRLVGDGDAQDAAR